VNVFFDNCTAPIIAATLDAFISFSNHRAFHIKDLPGLPKGRHSADLDWITYLQQDPDDWAFVTGDGRVSKNPATRVALRSAGLHGFVLAPAYQKTPLHQLVAAILWKWPEMENLTQLVAAPAIFEVPIGKMSKLRQLPL